MSERSPARRIPSQARSDATVRSILDASRSILHDGDELTARRIAARAGVAAPTVYRYFADMAGVIDALVHEHATTAEQMVADVLAGHRLVGDLRVDAGTAFRAVLDGYLDLYRRRPELTVVWRSALLAERQRLVEAASDRALAQRLAAHLGAGHLAAQIDTAWQMAGTALGAVLRADGDTAASAAEAELRAFVEFAAHRLAAAARVDVAAE